MDSHSAAPRARASGLSPAPNGTPAQHHQRPGYADATRPRNPVHLPTPMERLVLLLFPAILLFGTLFSLLSPQTRSSAFDPVTQAHSQDSPPSYFAHKGNIFNVWFVKRGWAWTTAAFLAFLLFHPALAHPVRRARAASRWALVTLWWVLVTQWFFGPPIIDRGFRWTGGKCEVVEERLDEGEADAGDFFTAVACRAAGGRWHGGHDISGHVFLLVLGSGFLLQELGWAVGRWTGRAREERSVVMVDGAVKGAGVEGRGDAGEGSGRDALGFGGRVILGVVGLKLWMLLMTAMYFHTWFEKFTGLFTAMAGLYVIYVLPRAIPSVRQLVGLPGV